MKHDSIPGAGTGQDVRKAIYNAVSMQVQAVLRAIRTWTKRG